MTLNSHHLAKSVCLLAVIALACVGIARSAEPQPKAVPPALVPVTPPDPESTPGAQLPVADLSEIRFRRKFRILVPAEVLAKQRDNTISAAARRHIELIKRFAEEQFLLPVQVAVPRWQDLAPALHAGRGDLIGAHMQISELRERNTPFTVPVADTREVLVAREADQIHSAADLNGREIALSARSSFWPKLQELRRLAPTMKVRIIDDSTDPETVLKRIASMQLDMAVIDYGTRELGVSPWQAVHAVPQFSSTTTLAFGVHPDNTELKRVLNEFLAREQLVHRDSPARTDDLDEISQRGVLRVLTRNNDSSYFIWRGRPLGFEYELMRRFADKQKLSLEMILKPSHDQLVPALLEGTGDIVASDLVPNAKLQSLGATFTRPYRQIQKYVITRADDESLQSPSDLMGRTLTLRHSSPASARIQQLVRQGLDVKINTLPETVRNEEIIAGVATGLYNNAIADASAMNTALSSSEGIRSAFAWEEPVSVSWAVRENNPQLLNALNEFLDDEYKQLFYNVIHKRYFENTRFQRARITNRLSTTLTPARLSPYDDIVREQAKKYGFDWPLVVAVMFKESRFDPNVISWAGARGLMQVLPATAKRFGISDLEDPTSSIIAGVRMLSWLYHKLDDDLSVQDRTWFTLAAYNAGLGHLLDARRLSRTLKLDPNRWFDNVETAMRLLEQPEYYRKSRHGYVRGMEPVNYVRDIRELYNAYKNLPHS